MTVTCLKLLDESRLLNCIGKVYLYIKIFSIIIYNN